MPQTITTFPEIKISCCSATRPSHTKIPLPRQYVSDSMSKQTRVETHEILGRDIALLSLISLAIRSIRNHQCKRTPFTPSQITAPVLSLISSQGDVFIAVRVEPLLAVADCQNADPFSRFTRFPSPWKLRVHRKLHVVVDPIVVCTTPFS